MQLRLTESQLRQYITEEIKVALRESFNSSKLKDWFNEHGGVMNRYEGDDYDFLNDKRVRQDGLGDVSDEDILSIKEFDNIQDARSYCWDKNHPMSNYGRSRLPFDSKALYTIYKAKDGSCLVVGLDKSRVEIGTTWGGDMTKKTADRVMTNGWNPKTRNNRYVDDSDTYYYHNKGKDFGIHTNREFNGKREDNLRKKEYFNDEEWTKYQEMRKERMKEYLNKYYPNEYKDK